MGTNRLLEPQVDVKGTGPVAVSMLVLFFSS